MLIIVKGRKGFKGFGIDTGLMRNKKLSSIKWTKNNLLKNCGKCRKETNQNDIANRILQKSLKQKKVNLTIISIETTSTRIKRRALVEISNSKV